MCSRGSQSCRRHSTCDVTFETEEPKKFALVVQTLSIGPRCFCELNVVPWIYAVSASSVKESVLASRGIVSII